MGADKKEMDQAKVNQRFVQMSHEKRGLFGGLVYILGDEKFYPVVFFWIIICNL